jgi:prepilin-type N-terminal cleavage/methylation domain-containing protein
MHNTLKRLQARSGSGFTLIELLVVIAILAILSGVVVFAVGKSTANADKVACQTERASLITAHKAAVTSNKVNATTDQETWADYLENPSLKYFATPTATYTGTPTMTAARTTQGGTIADCTAISV